MIERHFEETDQYTMPTSIERRMGWYDNRISHNLMREFYALSIEEVLVKYKINNICDIPYGNGYKEAVERWEEKIRNYTNIKRRKKGWYKVY